MKVLLLAFCLSSDCAASPEQYPEDRFYTSVDKGYSQYGAPSLHGTGKFSLTFDDGPHPIHTPKILDSLTKYNVKATFFVITSLINQKTFPIFKRMLDEGHIVASHGKSHDNSNNLSRDLWKSKVKNSFQELSFWHEKAGHKMKGLYYRFPYAAYGTGKGYHHLNALKEISNELFGKNCIQFAFWDKPNDSGDWIPKISSGEVYQNLVAMNEGGSFITYKTIRNSQGKKIQIKVPTVVTHPLSGGITLQHDIQPSSVLATEQFLQYAQDRNLEILPLDQVEEFKVKTECL